MIRLASINIEGHTHLERVIPFLQNYKPDVVCLQELSEFDIPTFERELDMKCSFLPMAIWHSVPRDTSSPVGKSGLGILSKVTPLFSKVKWYWGNEGALTHFDHTNRRNSVTGAVLYCEISFESISYTFATTHFTWTPDGNTTDEQRADLKNLFEILGGLPDFVLAGDFNAPRGKEIFGAIAARYKDNIPVEYVTSIDKNLHRAGALPHMVDGLFTTPEYLATDVKLSEGVSDHMAITALISRTS